FGLGDRDGARTLQELLLPHRDTWVVSVTAITVSGPVTLFLGILALALGDRSAAAAELDAATRQCREAGYVWLVEECETWMARATGGVIDRPAADLLPE